MSEETGSGWRRYPPSLWILFAGRLITASGFSFSFPFFAMYATGTMHVPAARVGLVLLCGGLSGAFAKLFGGEWTDRWGRKPVMLMALGGRAVTSAAMALSLRFDLGFGPLAALLVASNFSGQLFEPSSQAFIADITSGKRRVEALGILRMGINAGWAIGPAAAAAVAMGSFAFALAVTAGVFTLSFLIILLAIREPRHLPGEKLRLGDIRLVWGNQAFVSLCLCSMLIAVVQAQLVGPTSVYATTHAGLTPRHVAAFFSLNGALVFLFQFPASWWMARAGLLKGIVLGCCFYAVGYASVAFDVLPRGFLLSVTVITMGEVLVAGSNAFAAELAPDASRGRYLGIWMLFSNLGWCLGPALGGVLLDARPGRSGMLWFPVASIAVLAAVGFARLGLSRRTIIGSGASSVIPEVVAG